MFAIIKKLFKSVSSNSHHPPTFRIPLPQGAPKKRVKSFNDETLEYIVDISNMTCTCPDFYKKRSALPIGDLRRACKHLKQELCLDKTLNGTIYEALIKSDYYSEQYYPLNNNTVVIGYIPGKEWVNVFAGITNNKTGNFKFDRFGYSLPEGRWSYKLSPNNADLIAGWIDDLNLESKLKRKLSSAYRSMGHVGYFTEEEESYLLKLYHLSNSILNDDDVDKAEIEVLNKFISSVVQSSDKYPFNILHSKLREILSDGKVTIKERGSLRSLLGDIANVLQ